MGLDMYLDKVFYLSKFSKNRDKLKITGVEGININKVKEIKEEAIYWRKTNHIHKWFVNNVQNENDDCRTYDVSREKLQELYDMVCEVLNSTKLIDGDEKGKILKDSSKAKELLPTQKGLFFGSYNYDEYYWNDLITTRDKLKKILDKRDSSNIWYKYHSSW